VLLLLVAFAPETRAAGAQPGSQEPLSPTAVEIDAAALAEVSALLAPPADRDAPEPAATVEKLCGLGARAAPVLVGMLAGEIEAPLVLPGTTPGAEERPVHPLALEQRPQVLREALACLPPSAVLEHLATRLESGLDWQTRLWIADLLGRLEDPEACVLLVDLVEGFEAVELRRRYVQETLERALVAHLVRAPETLDVVWESGFDAPAERLGLYARAIGATRTSHGIDLLADWLDMRPEADVELLTQIGRSLGAGGLAVPPATLDAVRSKLQAQEPEVRRSAIIAAGRLRDEAAFEDLVRMLADQPELVSASARWSLKAIAGMDLGADGQAWLDWRQRELAWLEEQGPAVLEDLQSKVPGVVLAAVTEALRHPLHRHVVADALGPLLAHPDPAVARGVCVAIARLQSSHSVPWLLAALKQADPELSSHAAQALHLLTGLDLPAEHDAWSRALSG
jgi:HEAT repeat protein